MSEAVARTRAIELEVTVDAPIEAVWKALSEGDEMQRWFPPEARIEPGAGGRIWLSWGPGMEAEAIIETWEPNRRITWVERAWSQGDVPVRIAVDFELEGRAGSTIVRLVHSGFGAEAEWDEMFDATRAGWTYFLFHLAFYLVRHRGVVRRLVSARRQTTKPVAEVWRALLGPRGLNLGTLAPGRHTTMEVDRQTPLNTRVEMVREPSNFGGVIESLNDGVVFIEMEPGAPSWHCGVWISLYGVAETQASALQSSLDRLMDEVLPVES